MKKLNICLVLLVILCLVGFKHSTTNEDQKVKEAEATRLISDLTSPTITFKNEDGIVLAENEPLILSDYIEVEDEDENVSVTSFGKVDLTKAGSYNINIIAADSSKNVTSIEAEVKVVTQEEYEDYLKQKEIKLREKEAEERRVRHQEMVEYFASENDDLLGGTDIYELALQYVGRTGQCTTIAQSFLKDYFGHGSIYDAYEVSYEDAQPGDIITYANGGLGLPHVAIYLGQGKALHGNWKGSAVIADAIMGGASDPVFSRAN